MSPVGSRYLQTDPNVAGLEDSLIRQLRELDQRVSYPLGVPTRLITSGVYKAQYGELVRVDPTNAAVTVILPRLHRDHWGHGVSVCNITSSTAHAITIKPPDPGVTISGVSYATISTAHDGRTFVALTDETWFCKEDLARPGGSVSTSSPWNYLDMVLPDGYSGTIQALYQFDGTADSLTDRSGNGNDLTLNVGTESYVTIDDHTGLFFDGATYFDKNPGTASIRISGAITIEVVTLCYAGSVWLAHVGGPTDVQADNILWGLVLATSGARMQYFSEHGAGLDDNHILNSPVVIGQVTHLCMTRDGSGNLVGLQNGDLGGTGSTTMPDGGGSSFLRIGANNLGASQYRGAVFSLRVCSGAAMTAAHALQSNNRVRGQ